MRLSLWRCGTGHRRPGQLDSLTATRARLKRIERALARWDAYDAGQATKPPALSRAALENLRGMLEQVLAEKQAAARLAVWQWRN